MKKFLPALLFLIPALFLGAQQSFFIAPGQTIGNGDIARGYCLEFSQKELSKDNIAGLLHNIEGMVRVIYINKEPETINLQTLVSEGIVRFRALNSYEHIQVLFDNKSGIIELDIGESGISLFRKEMTDDENTLARENIKAILALKARNLAHRAIQENIWRIRLLSDSDTPVKEGVRTIDLKTTADPAEQVHTWFDGNATVDYRRNQRIFLRLDGILNGTEDFSPDITELVSHFHNDHISHAALESLLETGDFAGLFAPNVIRDDSQNQTFNMLKETLKTMGFDSETEEPILGITDISNPPLSVRTGSMGGFSYTTLGYRGNIWVTIFKYSNPKNPNTDGAIYQITHKNAGYLLFGDFDDPSGIENLLDASAENEKKRNDLGEQRSALMKQLYEQRNELSVLTLAYVDMLPDPGEDAVPDETLFRITVLERLLGGLYNTVEGLETEIFGLGNEIQSLPVLKADVVKWPHHAHIFTEANSREVIIKLNEVVNPQYFIYQAHHTQDLVKFKTFIDGFSFKEKFINSAEKPVDIISLEWFRRKFFALFTGKEGEAT